VSAFRDVEQLPALPIWDGVTAREVHGERVTFAVIELDPNAVIPEHSHDNEQLGTIVAGSMTFTIGGETREVTPGSTWVIPSHTPHDVVVGPDGAVVVEAFVPARDDWLALAPGARRAPRWP
jgi:quercetin dioxygenase-like cupin family protein